MEATTFILIATLTFQSTLSSLTDKRNLLNDDEYTASPPDNDVREPISRAEIMSDAVRRGIEKMVEESPFHRNKIETQALVEKIGKLLIHPPPAKQHETDGDDATKKSYVDEQHSISVNADRGKEGSSKDKEVNKKDTVDRNRESIGNLMYTKEETRRDNNKEASFSKKKEVVVTEHEQKKKNSKYDFELNRSANEDNDAKKKEEIESDSVSKVNESGNKVNESDGEAQLNETKQKEAIESLPPFEGYMKKLAGDVNGVMGDATEMLRDTGKLIKGLKRVVKGASTLSRVTNDAVKYAKYFSSEPENITVDFLEEKAIIALLDAQKAANESRKAANLARIASAKAVDVENRVESSEADFQDTKLVRPYVEATEILTGKAEKAAKLAKIEKKKTEKDFVQMNELLNKLKAKRISDSAPNYSAPTEFDKKRKELERELANFKNEVEPFRQSLSHLTDKLHRKPSKYEMAVKKSDSPIKDVVTTDLGKDAMSSIATELTKTIVQPPTEARKENRGSKKDVIHPKKQSSNEVTKEVSDNVGKEVSDDDGIEKTITVKITTDAAKILDAAAAEEAQKERENAEDEENTNQKMPRKLDAEQTFGDILRDSIENRDKIMSYLNQFSPQSPLSEDAPELKVNPEDTGEASETISRGGERKSNIILIDHKEDNKAGEKVKSYSRRVAKNDRNMILDYIDQDDASGEIGSPERTIYKNVHDDTAVASKNKYRAVRIFDRSSIPKKIPRNATVTDYHKKSYSRSNVPKGGPANVPKSTDPSAIVAKSLAPKNTSENCTFTATRLLSNDSINSPASVNPPVKDEIGYKKSTIPTSDDAYEDYDPFGFKKFEEQMKGQYRRRSVIPKAIKTIKKSKVVKNTYGSRLRGHP